MKKKKDQNKNLENGQLSRKKSSQKSLSVKMTNSINVATYEKYNKIYSNFNDKDVYKYQIVKEKESSSSSKTPASTKYDSNQKGSERVTGERKKEKEETINGMVKKNNNKVNQKKICQRKKHNLLGDEVIQNISFSIFPKSKQISRNLSNHIKKNTYKSLSKKTAGSLHKLSTASCSNLLCESLTHKPSLDKRSMAIAKRLSPSITRLTQKKKSTKKSNRVNAYSFDFNLCNNEKTNNIKPRKQTEEMYKKGLAQMSQKQKKYLENISKKENEYKKYSFRPQVNKDGVLLPNGFQIKNLKPEFNYIVQKTWKSKIQKQNDIRKIKIDEEEIEQCTFYPKINPLDISDDEEIINAQIPQLNDYINNRRLTIQKQKENEEYKNKKLGHNQNYQIKITVPKEFSFNINNRNAATQHHSRSSSIDIEDNRRKLGTICFFS